MIYLCCMYWMSVLFINKCILLLRYIEEPVVSEKIRKTFKLSKRRVHTENLLSDSIINILLWAYSIPPHTDSVCPVT